MHFAGRSATSAVRADRRELILDCSAIRERRRLRLSPSPRLCLPVDRRPRRRSIGARQGQRSAQTISAAAVKLRGSDLSFAERPSLRCSKLQAALELWRFCSVVETISSRPPELKECLRSKSSDPPRIASAAPTRPVAPILQRRATIASLKSQKLAILVTRAPGNGHAAVTPSPFLMFPSRANQLSGLQRRGRLSGRGDTRTGVGHDRSNSLLRA